jgi:hypothetical protein
MKYTLNKLINPSDYWNGAKPLPDEINVMSYHPPMSEFELLSILCTLHGCPTAYDLLTGSVPDTEKDSDISSISNGILLQLQSMLENDSTTPLAFTNQRKVLRFFT